MFVDDVSGFWKVSVICQEKRENALSCVTADPVSSAALLFLWLKLFPALHNFV